jgi:hypothetical protein
MLKYLEVRKKYLPAVYFLVIVFALFFTTPSSAHAHLYEPARVTAKSPLVPNQEGVIKIYLAHYDFLITGTQITHTVSVTPTAGAQITDSECEKVNQTLLFESSSYPTDTTFWTCTITPSFSAPGKYVVNFNYEFWNGIFFPTSDVKGTISSTITVVDGTLPDPSIYHFLAPVGCDPGTPGCVDRQLVTFDPSQKNALSTYLNIFIKILIGIAAVLAVVMIVMGGIQYMTSELVSGKTEGKKRIMDALIGLLLALAAVILLKTINPSLLSVEPNIGEVSLTYITGDAVGDDTVDANFATRAYSSSASISPAIVSAVEKLKQGWQISSFRVYRNNRMLVSLKNGSQTDNTTIIDILPGVNGYADIGTAVVGDKKTPSGSWRIIAIRYEPNKAQISGGKANLGAAFWHLNPMVSGERGVGMHGNKTGTLSRTNGCVRLKNADILALQPYVKVGIPLIVD